MTLFFEVFITIIFPVFVLIGFGVLMDRFFAIDVQTLSKFNFYLLLPALLFVAILKSDLDPAMFGTVVGFTMVHHVVMLVNMENVRWWDVVCLPSLPPSGKSVIVPFHNHRHRTGCPVQQLFEAVSSIRHLVEIVEVDIKDGVHRLVSPGGLKSQA